MRCDAELRAAHRSLADRARKRTHVVAADTLSRGETTSGHIETELVIMTEHVPASVLNIISNHDLGITAVASKGPDHKVVTIA
jgi:hypothetical protein